MKNLTKEEIMMAMENIAKQEYNQKLLTRYYRNEISWEEVQRLHKN